MLAGSLYGNSSPETGEKEKIFSLVQSLAASFKQEFGTLYCRELLGLVSGTPGCGDGAPRRKNRRLLRLPPL